MLSPKELLIDRYFLPSKNDHFFFLGGGGGGNFFFERGLILSWEIFIQVEDTLGQVGCGTRTVGRLHLSDRCYWAMNFNFFFNFGHF